MCVFDTFNKFLETVLHQLHKSIYTYLIQNKKKAAVLLILYQRFILKSNRRHFPSLQFTSSQINFCNSPLVYRFYTQQKYKHTKLHFEPVFILYSVLKILLLVLSSNILKYSKKRLGKNSLSLLTQLSDSYRKT